MEQENSKRKIIIITSITFIGMLVGILISVFLKKSFLFNPNDRFMDYFNTIRVLEGVYSKVGIGRGYFPFTYILLKLITVFFKTIPFFGYIVTFGIMSVALVIFYDFFIKNKLCIVLITITTFFSYPICFLFDRANIEYLVLLFLLFFFIAYRKEKFSVAAVLLAFPICMKLYPALFAILFLKNKKYKELILCIIYTTLLMFFSFITIGGNQR